MKRLVLMFALACASKAPVMAQGQGFMTGRGLHDGSVAAKKCEEGGCTEEQQQAAIEHMGYLEGVTDIAILSSNLIQIPPGTNMAQILAAVRIYLEKNPRMWANNIPAAQLVLGALAESFPHVGYSTEEPMKGAAKSKGGTKQ